MAGRRKTPSTMTDVLREAINDSELSFKAMEAQTGVLRQTLMRFAYGKGGLRLDKADKLAEYFGLELTTRKGK